MGDEKKKRGRPIIGEEPKTARIEGRVTNTTNQKFEYICKNRGLTKTAALEYLINNQYNFEIFLTKDD